jgi:hypothetical protein
MTIITIKQVDKIIKYANYKHLSHASQPKKAPVDQQLVTIELGSLNFLL